MKHKNKAFGIFIKIMLLVVGILLVSLVGVSCWIVYFQRKEFVKYEAPEGKSVREWVLEQSRDTTNAPNNCFIYCMDADLKWKLRTLYWQAIYGIEGTHDKYHYHTCINTALSFYNPHYTCAVCSTFESRLYQFHFKEVSKEDALPGDIVLFYDVKSGRCWHAAILDHFTEDDVYYNHSNGGCKKSDYVVNACLSKAKYPSTIKFFAYKGE